MFFRLGILVIVVNLLGGVTWMYWACDCPIKGQLSNRAQEKNRPGVDLDRAIFQQP